MISTLQISGVHSNLNKEMRDYIQAKIGGLDKYISKRARGSVAVEVKIKEVTSKNKLKFVCEVIMKLPKATLAAHKNSINALSAIDEVEANLKNQLKKYKDRHNYPRITRHIRGRSKKTQPQPFIAS